MKRTNAFYMANLGSEFIRAFLLHEKGDEKHARLSALRCFKIINDLMRGENRSAEIKEVLILEDILRDFMENNLKNYSINRKDLESYFNPFAMRVMSGVN